MYTFVQVVVHIELEEIHRVSTISPRNTRVLKRVLKLNNDNVAH